MSGADFLKELRNDLHKIGAEYRAWELDDVIEEFEAMERIVADKREKADLITLIEELAASNERMDRLLRDAADKMLVLGKENQELKAELDKVQRIW